MSIPEEIAIIAYHARYSRQAVVMWRESKRAALGVEDVHSMEDQLRFLTTELTGDNTVCLAIHQCTDLVVGIMAVSRTELSQLYIHVDYQRMGIGTRLLNLAKQCSGGRLQLSTFQVNTAAQNFYLKHHFRIIGRDGENEENLPDLRCEWIASGPIPGQ